MTPQPQPEPLFRQDELSAELRAELEDIGRGIPIDEGGGSSVTKMLVLASLIQEHDFRRAAEIGVYRGRIFLALGATMRALGRGEVIGIDPYSAEAAIQRDDHDVGLDLRTWPQRVDWDGLYAGVLRQLELRGLADYCRLDRRTSAEAAADIAPASVDLLQMATTTAKRLPRTSRCTYRRCGRGSRRVRRRLLALDSSTVRGDRRATARASQALRSRDLRRLRRRPHRQVTSCRPGAPLPLGE
jgi:hypothetical protein